MVMTVRERLEQEEYRELSPLAQKSAETKGRLYSEEDSDARTCYQRDADRIVHSKSFRRLMHKTQVFLSPEGDHYRTRMTHTIGGGLRPRSGPYAVRPCRRGGFDRCDRQALPAQ